MKDWENVIFDLDGTLTASEPGILRSIRYALECMGKDVPERERLIAFIGPPLYCSFRDLLNMTDAEAREAQRLFRECYRERGWMENSVYPGIPRLLRSLKKAGKRIFVATGKPRSGSERICRCFGLSPYLTEIAAPDDNGSVSDKTAMILDLIQRFGKETVMIGDRRFDVQGALNNGISAIGVTYGYGTAEELKRAGVSLLAEDVGTLYRLLLDEMPPARGVFLSLEGMDGCGKTTQREALVEYLTKRGWDVAVTREPGGDDVAEKIRAIILDAANTEMTAETEAYLYAASRAQNVRTRILPALADGKAVVCDRFVDSSIAYQGGGRDLGEDCIAGLNRLATGGLEPDITVFLDLNPEESIRRRLVAGEPDRLEREKSAFWKRVYSAYERICSENERIKRIDASGSIAEVTCEMLTQVKAALDEAAAYPAGANQQRKETAWRES